MNMQISQTAGNATSTKASPIHVSSLTKVFKTRTGDEVTALADTSFKIAGGEFVSIVGPSGCGKSTVMRIIAGLIDASKGAVLLGTDVVTAPSPEIGIAFQKAVLLPWLSVARNIALPAELEGRMSKADINARVEQLLEMVRLTGVGQRFPGELSGGMQQRVSIARALMTEPSVLLMDEPFGALDALTREHMHDELLAIWEYSHPTVVFITHDIGEAVYLSDRVLVMASRPGRVVADIRIDLPRPRQPNLRGEPHFARLGAEIRALIPH
ncbi:ABC transporter ATP-binding protein [Rhizobium sp. SL86]|uniref:ABC transporter ATP-binding protein n=1 Tax=Rhizobium sp. SL86 TaxID=2995148 RepID=UPI002274D96E|nr:ABC transporter ATP-binding protein [Rhizobium sp. SL86]MCY1667817.1 ABC transporter ATP-binding protein [Rhizobium sp. SL86]